MEALEGESLQMNFSMEPQLPSSTRHTVARTDGKKCTDKNRSHLFKIKKGDTITFPSVRVSDTGTYVISCQNSDGVEGKKNFKLNIKPGMLLYLSSLIGHSKRDTQEYLEKQDSIEPSAHLLATYVTVMLYLRTILIVAYSNLTYSAPNLVDPLFEFLPSLCVFTIFS